MPDQSQGEPNLAQAVAAEHFYSGALHRIGRFMAVLGPLLVAAAWWRFGVRPAVGFAFGCGIAYVNFHWLKRVIAGFVDRATGAATSHSGQGIVFRFLTAICFDGSRRLCYIDCFTREPEWASCGLIFARRRHRLRSGLRTVRSAGSWRLAGNDVFGGHLIEDVIPKSGVVQPDEGSHGPSVCAREILRPPEKRLCSG